MHGGWGARHDSYPSRGQSLAIRVRAHGQGTVEPYSSICCTVSALERQKEKNKKISSRLQKKKNPGKL